jgi:rRNA-processing protein FCF1
VLTLIVVLDTNFLMIPTQFGLDIFSEAERVLEKSVEFVVLESVVAELERNIACASMTDSRAFKIALNLAKRCRVIKHERIKRDTPVDDLILDYASVANAVIATNDRELRKRAHSRRIPVLFLRGKKQLQLMGYIV